jgi:hypothetical protein
LSEIDDAERRGKMPKSRKHRYEREIVAPANGAKAEEIPKPRKPKYIVWIGMKGTRGYQFRKYLCKNGNGKAKFISKFFSASMPGGKKMAYREANAYCKRVLAIYVKGMTKEEILYELETMTLEKKEALEGQAQGESIITE